MIRDYTFSEAKAEENLFHNWDEIITVANEFDVEPYISVEDYDHGAEWWDSAIRCYYLSTAISEALEEMTTEQIEA